MVSFGLLERDGHPEQILKVRKDYQGLTNNNRVNQSPQAMNKASCYQSPWTTTSYQTFLGLVWLLVFELDMDDTMIFYAPQMDDGIKE